MSGTEVGVWGTSDRDAAARRDAREGVNVPFCDEQVTCRTQTHTDTHRHTQTHTDTHRCTQMHRRTGIQTNRHTDKQRHTQGVSISGMTSRRMVHVLGSSS
eukprot:783268-Rhodomonas_salina.3